MISNNYAQRGENYKWFLQKWTRNHVFCSKIIFTNDEDFASDEMSIIIITMYGFRNIHAAFLYVQQVFLWISGLEYMTSDGSTQKRKW